MKKVLYILGDLADSDIEWLIRHGQKRNIAKGTVIVEEGKDIGSLYIIIDGLFSFTIAALQNRELNRIGSGEVLGEISCIDSREGGNPA